ncbi:MAG: AAA family ATPase [Aliifodinibius sp.]|nr:AAA family ATPase [Fodinibius sp.]NIY26977.1 AAA family ATPase [Fodinibius sp.]
MIILRDQDLLYKIGEQQSQFVAPASEWTQEVIKRLRGDIEVSGDLMPWSKTHSRVAFRPGEVTLWGGYNGHGKSQVLNQICAWLLQRSKWLIASMEMKPAATMARMCRQIAGCRDVNPIYAQKFMDWTDNRLWIYDQTDTVRNDRILGVVLYGAKVLGADHIVIDSLMKCGFNGRLDEVAGQQVEFVDRLCWAAKSHDVHIHLVHHMRKGEGTQGEYSRPGKHDFRGNGAIVDLVDNAIISHRNKRKEAAMAKGETMHENEPDQTLEVVKQRHGEWEGIVKLWFHPDSLQYLPKQTRSAMPYRMAA